MSAAIPLIPAEFATFVQQLFENKDTDPSVLKKTMVILKKMAFSNPEKRAILSQYPAFEIYPKALSSEHINLLMTLTGNKPQPMPYGRDRLWTDFFSIIVRKGNPITPKYNGQRPINVVLDHISAIFFDAMRQFNEFKDGMWRFGIYIDRNTVTSENAEKSGFTWHRDGFEDNSPDIAHYTLFLLLSDNSLWKGGVLSFQIGGDSDKSGKWVKSTNPEVNVTPRFNQAIVLRNFDSLHKIEPIFPENGLVRRDIAILTCMYSKT